MKNPFAVLLATLGIAIGGSTLVYGASVGYSYLYGNNCSGYGCTNPLTTVTGTLAAAHGDAGVNVMNSPAPTAVGQALLAKSIGPSASANWATIPGANADMIWTIRSSAADNSWYSVTYGNGTFVAVAPTGTGNRVMTSPDGIAWTIRSSAADNSWSSVTYGNGTFVAVATTGTGNRVMTSPDGITWTIRSSAADNSWHSVTYGNGTFVAVANTGTGNRVMTSPPWTNTPLSSSVPPLVAAGPGVAGTGTSAQRSDSQQGLSATNPNKGDFFRSPVGTDSATNTSIGWDHALDLVRYAGSGTADPTAGAGVPCLLASGSPLSMCLYYQTVHCNDGGCSYAIWWKSGSGDTQWTQFGTGGGGGGGTIALTSPLGTINIGAGGGLTTEDVVYGHAIHTALQGSEWNVASGVCPLDPNTMVPLANLYPSTESHAGTMSAADKTKLDGISAGATVDAFTVKAASGSTPGYLGAVCESTDSSITIGQTGDYVTFAANFGTGAAQVCSGATCAGLQSQLPACAPGQIEIFGTVTQTGTATGTVTSRTCQNSPYQPVGSYQPALPPGTNNQVLAYSVTGTGTGTNIVAKTPSVNAGNGISVSGTNPVTGLTISANIASSRNISTATASTTAVSTATTMYGSDSQVVLPVANATTQGISKVASNAAIASSTNTGTASSTAGATCMPADATANGDHRVSVASGSTPYYLGDAVIAAASPAVGGAPIALSIDDEGGGVKYLMLGARAGSSSVSGMVRLDPNAPPALDGGPATTGSRGLAADSGNKPKLGGNSPTPRQALIGGTCSNTATGTNTTTAINFCPLQVTDVNGAVGGSGSTSHYSKWTAGSQLGNAFITEDAAQPQMNGSFSAGTTSIDYVGPAQYSAMELPRGELLFSNTNASNQAYLVSNAYEKSDGTQAYRYTGPAAGLGMQDGIIYALTAPSGTQNAAISWVTQATISSTGIAGSNITATPTANAIPKADGSGTLNAWVTNHASIFHDTSLATTVAIGDYPTWHTILTFNTGGTAGAIVVHATVTVKCNGGGSSAIAYVRLAMGAAQLDGQYLATVPAAAYGYYGYATLSANSYAPFSAGAHTVGLQAYTDTTSCVVQGNDQITGGSAVLVATEYTN